MVASLVGPGRPALLCSPLAQSLQLFAGRSESGAGAFDGDACIRADRRDNRDTADDDLPRVRRSYGACGALPIKPAIARMNSALSGANLERGVERYELNRRGSEATDVPPTSTTGPRGTNPRVGAL